MLPQPVDHVESVAVRQSDVEDQQVGLKIDAGVQRILAGVSSLARKADIQCTTLHAKDQYPAEGILETANNNHCDLIVMASHGRRGLGRLLLGSQAVRVLTNSTIPVLICR